MSKNLPVKPLVETFYIKGTQHPHLNTEVPLINVVQPYFSTDENILVVLPYERNTKKWIERMSKETVNIVNSNVSDSNVNIVDNNVDNNVSVVDNNANATDSNRTVYYNSFNKEIFTRKTIIFIDYCNIKTIIKQNNLEINYGELYRKKHREIISEIKRFIMPENSTIICKEPGDYKIDFIFSGTEELKEKTLEQIKKEDDYVHQKDSEIPEILLFKRCIFLGVDAKALNEILDRIPEILLVYSKADFSRLSTVVSALEERDISVPEFILKIATSQCS